MSERLSPEQAHHKRVRKGAHLGRRAVEAEVFQDFMHAAQDELIAKQRELEKVSKARLPLTPRRRAAARTEREERYQALARDIRDTRSQERGMRSSYEAMVNDDIDDMIDIIGQLTSRERSYLGQRAYDAMPPYLRSVYEQWHLDQIAAGGKADLMTWLEKDADDAQRLNFLQWQHAHVEAMNGDHIERRKMKEAKDAFRQGVDALIADGRFALEMAVDPDHLAATDMHYGDLLDYYSEGTSGYASVHEDGQPVIVLYTEPGGKTSWHELHHTEKPGFNVGGHPAYQILNEAFTEMFAQMTAEHAPLLKAHDDPNSYQSAISIVQEMYDGDEDDERGGDRAFFFEVSRLYAGKSAEQNAEVLREYLESINQGVDVVGVLMSVINCTEFTADERESVEKIAEKVLTPFKSTYMYVCQYLNDPHERARIDDLIDDPATDEARRTMLTSARFHANRTLQPA